MKTSNKSKGFTLIELMVVIAIIALLSSVVLASLKGAREKAVLAKTVGEMKSLQTAIELYRNQLGVYPGRFNPYILYNDDTANNSILNNSSLGYDNLDDLLTLTLKNGKFISKVPHAPNYPNNCTVSDCDAGDNGYVLGYSYAPNSLKDNYNYWFTCGGKNIDNYTIFFNANNKKLNLPILLYNDGSAPVSLTFGDPTAPPYIYCLSM